MGVDFRDKEELPVFNCFWQAVINSFDYFFYRIQRVILINKYDVELAVVLMISVLENSL